MRVTISKACFIVVLLCSVTALAKVVPYLSFRSQSVNAARELVGWQTQINKYGMCDLYGSLSITPEYTRSFKAKDLAQALFCDALSLSCCDQPTLRIQGTKVANRDAKALMAENFYLPTDYNSVITLEPRVENFLVDFNFYLGLGSWLEGLYFRVHAPVCYTRASLNYNEEILNPGSAPYDPGYFTDTWSFNGTATIGFLRDTMLGSFQEYITDGNSIPTTNGILFDPLCNARWSRCRMTKTAVADLEMALGWNFVSCPDYHLGLQIRGAAPTGNRPTGQYLFEPIVGQGHHWELGGGLTSHYAFWRSCDECQSFDVYFDANITHLFKARQCRTFDLVNKPLSRYMLAAKFGTPVTDLYAVDTLTSAVPLNGTFQAPSAQFKKEYMPVANISTIPVDVSAAVQADLVLKLAYTRNCWQLDLGYNFWARTCEKLCPRCDTCCTGKFPSNTWGLKGDAFMFGFPMDATIRPPTILTQGIGLSATESNATIFKGTNNYPDGLNFNMYDVFGPFQYGWNLNPGIDNPKDAVWQDSNPIVYPLVTKENGPTPFSPFAFTSLNPVFIKESDLDINGARQKGLSNKIFAHFGYTWEDHCNWIPYLGVGAEVEFGSLDKKCCCTSKTSCKPCTTTTSKKCATSCKSGKKNKNTDCMNIALSQWGVWIKGGVSFNS